MKVWVASNFGLLWIMLLRTFMCMFLCGLSFISLGYILGVELLGHIMTNSKFNFWKLFQTVFQSGYTSFHSYQHCLKGPISPPTRQHLLSPFFDYSHPSGRDVLPLCGFSLKKNRSHPYAQFKKTRLQVKIPQLSLPPFPWGNHFKFL